MDRAVTRPRPLRALSRPVPLAQIAYERIRRGLAVGGELEGLDRLIEQELAERLQMSRTPVRDALHRLALMGFLEPSAGGGYVRRTFTIRDAREHYELRVLLEPVAAALAAERAATSSGRATMAGLDRLAESAIADDGRFHVQVAELSGNDALARVIASVVERLIGFGIRETGIDHPNSVQAAHRRIVEAIESGQTTARDEMERHLIECQQALVADLGGGHPRPIAADQPPLSTGGLAGRAPA